MPRGFTPCRYCKKLIPIKYRNHHERKLCREMKRIARSRSTTHPEIPRVVGPLDRYLEA